MLTKRVYLSLGSNLGDRARNLECAIEALEREEIRVIARSSVYETEPQEIKQQAWFLNLVIECETRYFPMQLLGRVQKIELEGGRVRPAAMRKGPRTIDIDVLLFGRIVMNSPQLTIPHPSMLARRFVLEPLVEIAPDLKHPETNEPLRGYLSKVAGQKVRKIEASRA